MKKIVILFVAFIAALVVSCGGGDKEEKPECINSSDCGDNQECREGSCFDKEPEQKPECVTSDECPEGKECQNGSCVTVPPAEYCGDGIVNNNEACDDGTEANDGHYGGCNEDCTLAAFCGDGIKNGEEACDDGTEGNVGTYNGCKADCTLAEYCGDGVKNGTEECDDGTDNGTYGYCNALCTGVGDYCGDGVKNGEEACDDGANNGKYGYCKTDCSGLGERCGDAIIQKAVCPLPPEENNDDDETSDEETTDTDTEASDTEASDADTTAPENPDTDADAPEVSDTDAAAPEASDADTDAVDPVTPDSDAPAAETPDTDAPAIEPVEECVVVEMANENCDEGEFNGVYGHCNAECTGFYGCGDGVLQADQGEECDYGANNGTEYCNYGNEGQEGEPCKRCTADCKLSEEDATLSYCGDAVTLHGEACDDGAATNGTIYGQCNEDCSSLMICGDGVVQDFGNEICDSNTKTCSELGAVYSAESEAQCNECTSWDESTCQCAEHYSGSDCLTCDGAHFCNGHGSCVAEKEHGTVTCSCTDHFTGTKCTECEEGYHINDAGTMCIEDCSSTCGQQGVLNLYPTSHGHCDYSGSKGQCVCDPCFTSTLQATLAPTLLTPECSEYASGTPGC